MTDDDDMTPLIRMLRETERRVWKDAAQQFWERMGTCDSPRLTTWKDHASGCDLRRGYPCNCPASWKFGR